MRKIAIIGAGESGAQLALGLQREGYDVTLFSDRSAAQIRTGKVMSSQCMFPTALAAEAQLSSALTKLYDDEAVPGISSIRLRVEGESGSGAIEWEAPLEGTARSVDQRIKSAAWIEAFVAGGGDFRIEKVTPRMLEELARDYELVIVSAGKGEIAQIFPKDRSKSPFDRPQRVLALNYVSLDTVSFDAVAPDSATGPAEQPSASIRMSVVPGVGEFFTFPGLSVSGPCQMMVFEGVVGGPMDKWTDVTNPEEQLSRSLEILEEHFPTRQRTSPMQRSPMREPHFWAGSPRPSAQQWANWAMATLSSASAMPSCSTIPSPVRGPTTRRWPPSTTWIPSSGGGSSLSTSSGWNAPLTSSGAAGASGQ
ncbi:styrene monooxygenase/indole monooxygenase family protein [Arthrobacter sp. alpha11c]